MPASQEAILIIAGGWHTPQSYSKLTTALQSSGYDVHVPPHPSMNGSRPPNADLCTDSAHIRSYAEKLVDNGRKVSVVMHSYGGQVGTNALHGLGTKDRANAGRAGGVEKLIYMAACALPEKKAMIDMVRHHGHEDLMPLAFDFAPDMSCVSRDPETLLVGADAGLPGAQVQAYLATLARWNGNCMYQPMSTERAAWRDIPVTYIHTTKDMTVPLDYQKWLVDEMRKEGVQVQTATLETGHCPHFVVPDEVADVVGKVVRGEKLALGGVDEGSARSQDDVKNAILDLGAGKA